MNNNAIKEIVIQLGEKEPVYRADTVKVFVDGKKIDRLVSFDFHASVDDVPTMIVETHAI